MPVLSESESESTEELTTSTGVVAILQQDLQPPTEDTDIVMRDRVPVRMLYSKQDGFARYMDETHLTETTNVKQEEWGEFIVAWRRGRIERYEDYVIVRLIPATCYNPRLARGCYGSQIKLEYLVREIERLEAQVLIGC